MNCPHCKARNPIGNKFCRECGQKLPLDENPLAAEEAERVEAERSRERSAALLTEAFALSQQGKPAEALPLATEAAELLPESTSALTLCATLYERLGQNDKAIATMEKVVSLNPDSQVDADKLDRLRRGVHLLPRRASVPEATQPTERRWLPILIASGAGIIALGFGIASVVQLNRPAALPRKGTRPVVPISPTPVPAALSGAYTPSSGLGPLSAPPTVPQTPRPDPFAPVNPLTSPVPQGRPGSSAGRANTPGLPNPRQVPVNPGGLGNGSAGVGGTPPLVLPGNPPAAPAGSGTLPPLGGVQRNTDPILARPPQGQGSGGIPAGPPQNNGQSSNGQSQEATPPENPSFIRIRDHRSSSEPSRRASMGAPEDALLKAQTLQVSGKYREAITAYREALSTGAAVGEVQQGIALCYQRLGEKSAARTAYQQAIVAFEAQVRGGSRVDQANRGLAACRAALNVLGQDL